MKKVLLLFVLFLGLNVGAFAVNEMESESVQKCEAPKWVVVLFQDGTWLSGNDGDKCTHFYIETDYGGTQYMGSNC